MHPFSLYTYSTSYVNRQVGIEDDAGANNDTLSFNLAHIEKAHRRQSPKLQLKRTASIAAQINQLRVETCDTSLPRSILVPDARDSESFMSFTSEMNHLVPAGKL